jgi:hypothetical protein
LAAISTDRLETSTRRRFMYRVSPREAGAASKRVAQLPDESAN